MPYLQVLSDFREGVRKIAREQKGEAPLAWVGPPRACSVRGECQRPAWALRLRCRPHVVTVSPRGRTAE